MTCRIITRYWAASACRNEASEWLILFLHTTQKLPETSEYDAMIQAACG